MEGLMLVSVAVDCAAVAAIAWLIGRARRERDGALAAQRDALERLRGDLAALVGDAESRARTLEASLGAREERLRALLAETARVERARPAAPASEVPPRLPIDPAEARLLHDLQRS